MKLSAGKLWVSWYFDDKEWRTAEDPSTGGDIRAAVAKAFRVSKSRDCLGPLHSQSRQSPITSLMQKQSGHLLLTGWLSDAIAKASCAKGYLAVPLSKPFGLKLTLLFAASLTIMSGATIAPSLPGLRDRFAGTPDVDVLARLVLTMPALFIVLTAPFAGWMIDRIGRLRLLIGSAVVYAVAGMSGLVLDSLGAILTGRAVLGIAVGAVMTTTTVLVGDYFAGAARDRFMGLQAAFVGFSGMVFLTGGGVLADLSWRVPFAIYGSALPLTLAFLTEPDQGTAVAVEPDGEGRLWLVPLLFTAAFVNMLTFYLVPTQLPFLLADTMGIETPSRAGLAIGLNTLVSALASLAYRRIRSRVQAPMIFALGFCGMSIGFLLIGVSPNYGMVLVGAMAVGAGMGLLIPLLMVATLGSAPIELRGRVSGGLTAAFFLGQFASPFVSQPLARVCGLPAVFVIVALGLGVLSVALVALTYWRNVRPATRQPSR